MSFSVHPELPLAVLEFLPNPVMVKNADLQYVWVNPAFESLFGVYNCELQGQLDVDVFKELQAVKCNGGDMRVLQSGDLNEAYETVVAPDGAAREIIIRKSRLQLSNGDFYLIGVMHDVTVVTRANERLNASQAILEAQTQELKRLAHTDPLTNCINRRAIFEQAPSVISLAQHSWALLALDIDHFKKINDTYGHDAGDAALVHFADTVRQSLRQGDLFARMAGEEFVVILLDVSAEQSAEAAQRLCKLVAQSPCVHRNSKFALTVSIGTIHATAVRAFDLDSVLKAADIALYKAKRTGRNCVVQS